MTSILAVTAKQLRIGDVHLMLVFKGYGVFRKELLIAIEFLGC